MLDVATTKNICIPYLSNVPAQPSFTDEETEAWRSQWKKIQVFWFKIHILSILPSRAMLSHKEGTLFHLLTDRSA